MFLQDVFLTSIGSLILIIIVDKFYPILYTDWVFASVAQLDRATVL